MSQQNQLPEDSFERSMEQGVSQDPNSNPLAQMKPSGGGGGIAPSANPLDMVTSLVDPNAWVRELYGVPNPPSHEASDGRGSKQEQKKRREQEEGSGEAQGKQKQKLGQPRRKATTELHPETKAGGAK